LYTRNYWFKNTPRFVFLAVPILLVISSVFYIKKAEALSIYFAARGYAFRVNEKKGNVDTAIHLFKRAIQQTPELMPPDAYYRLAFIGFTLGESHKDILENGRSWYPNHPTIEMAQGVAAYLNIDPLIRKQGESQIDHAHSNTSSPELLRADTAVAFQNLAGFYHQQKRYIDAIPLYYKALQFKSDYPTALFNLGNALNAHGDTLHAIEAYRQALILEPELEVTLQNLAASLFTEKRYGLALLLYEEITKADPKNATAHYNLGVTYMAQAQLQKAEASLRKAIALDTSDSDSFLRLAQLLYEQKRFDEAATFFQHITELDPGNFHAFYNLGILLLSQNKTDEALKYFETASLLDSDDVDVHLALAQIFYQKGQIQKAIFSYRGALKNDPENQVAQAQIDLIRKQLDRSTE
jgi:tetratricopeptide (TPR) repeat protein